MRYIILALFFPISLFAQNKKTAVHGWRVITSAGLIAGESNTRPVFQLSGGMVRNRHFAGIGVGYETYRFNSYPVFANWQMDVGKNGSGFCMQAAGIIFRVIINRRMNFIKQETV